ncbi:hypothetical protein BCR39DRAFT_522283 [Naematelia encephala]|uniref:Uncharacterized protein n=1 Tax=Naematelia encephala TaxID=71784 RepID=A0A1Y2BFM5_9TREE|nr:hypothetical protein BCR39DRAFT_522283 [Naematelia encephala]
MFLLGHNLPDTKLVRIALTSFYGISHHISSRLLARLQIHQTCLVNELTEPQITALSAYLSSPNTTPAPPPTPLNTPTPPPFSLVASSSSSSSSSPKTIKVLYEAQRWIDKRPDPLSDLKIETELRKELLANIAHLRQIGTYRGKRHAGGFPVRGQRTKTNGHTAGRLNKIDRRGFSTYAGPTDSPILSMLSRSRI